MNTYNLDETLLHVQHDKNSLDWTLRNAFEGVQIFGGIGSGKSSGSARTLALKYLKAGFGGLVLTVKPDEKDMWAEYCQLAGRTDDLIIIEPGGPYRFNFLEYITTNGPQGKSITENIVSIIKTVIRAGEEKQGGKDDPFWESALDMLMFNVIDLCLLAYGKVTIDDLYNIVQSIPKKEEVADKKESNEEKEEKVSPYLKAFRTAEAKVNRQKEEFLEGLTASQLQELSDDRALADAVLNDCISDLRLLNQLDDFFPNTYYNLSEKTRSIIDFSFSGFLFKLTKEPVYSLLCRGTSNVVPEDCLDGKIILVNLPVKYYTKVGRDSQVLIKYIWQTAMEKRDVAKNGRPVFLFCDEAQHFLHEFDAECQATARSSRIATVYITQNLPNYYAAMSGKNSEYRVKSFLGTLATKIFHANADIETNKYASDLIGDAYYVDVSRGTSFGKSFSSSKNKSIKLEKMVRPETFASLRNGGPKNNFSVACYIHWQGTSNESGANHMRISFNQNKI